MYTTKFIIEKIGVTGAYKVLYCITNNNLTDNTKLTVPLLTPPPPGVSIFFKTPCNIYLTPP